MKKTITKPDWWKEVPIMNVKQLADFCQQMYDADNWRGLNYEERKKFEIAKKLYLEKTGKNVSLIYSCPP